MNWAVVVSALEKHVRMSQSACNFYRLQKMDGELMQALPVLNEAVTALQETKLERDRQLREKNLNRTKTNFSKGAI